MWWISPGSNFQTKQCWSNMKILSWVIWSCWIHYFCNNKLLICIFFFPFSFKLWSWKERWVAEKRLWLCSLHSLSVWGSALCSYIKRWEAWEMLLINHKRDDPKKSLLFFAKKKKKKATILRRGNKGTPTVTDQRSYSTIQCSVLRLHLKVKVKVKLHFVLLFPGGQTE